MIFNTFKKGISLAAKLTPNYFLPKIGEYATCKKISAADWAEFYLVARFFFALTLAIAGHKSFIVVWVISIIQICSIIYLLKIVFPVGARGLNDPSRSLFFAFGHYLEIGLSMGYVYWTLGEFTQGSLTLAQSVYFSFVTMTTTGFGDYTPCNDITRLIVTIHSVVSMFMLATVIGLFLSLSSQKDDGVKNGRRG